MRWWWFAVLVGFLGGCQEKNPLYCDKDLPCPMDQVCNQLARQCMPQRPRCNPDGWCSEQLPVSTTLRRVFAFSDKDAWVVGDGGTLLHWDGARLNQLPSGTTTTLMGLWGAGPGSPGSLWIGGATGTLLRGTVSGAGISLSAVPSGTQANLHALWGSGPEDLWIVGAQGVILRWDGRTVKGMPSGTLQDLHAVWGASPNDVWIVGNLGTILRWNGSMLSVVPFSGPAPVPLIAAWGSGANDVYLAPNLAGIVANYQGRSLALTPTGISGLVSSIWGTSSKDVWFCGLTGGEIAHWNGASFHITRTGVTQPMLSLSGFGETGPVFAVGTATFLHYGP